VKAAHPAVRRGSVRRWRRDFPWSQFADLVGVEPNEMTGAANIDGGSCGIVGKRDFDHGMTATGAITPGPTLAVERAQPERVDRFVGESVTQ